MTRPRRWSVAVLCALIGAACSSTLAPDERLQERAVRPELDELVLRIDGTGVPRDEILTVRAELAPDEPEIRPGDRLPLRLAKEGGEPRSRHADPAICEPDGARYMCDQFRVTGQDGVDLRDLSERVEEQLDGRVRIVQMCTTEGCFVSDASRGEIVLFGGSAPEAAHTARLWPEIEDVGLDYVRCSICRPDERIPNWFNFRMPVHVIASGAGNGLVEAEPGDTYRVEYRQPDGTVLAATATVE